MHKSFQRDKCIDIWDNSVSCKLGICSCLALRQTRRQLCNLQWDTMKFRCLLRQMRWMRIFSTCLWGLHRCSRRYHLVVIFSGMTPLDILCRVCFARYLLLWPHWDTLDGRCDRIRVFPWSLDRYRTDISGTTTLISQFPFSVSCVISLRLRASSWSSFSFVPLILFSLLIVSILSSCIVCYWWLLTYFSTWKWVDLRLWILRRDFAGFILNFEPISRLSRWHLQFWAFVVGRVVILGLRIVFLTGSKSLSFSGDRGAQWDIRRECWWYHPIFLCLFSGLMRVDCILKLFCWRYFVLIVLLLSSLSRNTYKYKELNL